MKMDTDGMDGHAHDGFEVTGDIDAYGDAGVDYETLGRLVGAAFDGCTACRAILLPRAATSPPTTARLVELACTAVHGALGGLPAGMTDQAAPGLATMEFRALATAGLDGRRDALFMACAGMTDVQRAGALGTALDVLVGVLATG